MLAADRAAPGAPHGEGYSKRYLEALTPSTIAAICGDFRASLHADREHEAADRAAGRRIEAPVLVITGADETQLADAPDVWRSWAIDVTEEAPEELTEALAAFLAA